MFKEEREEAQFDWTMLGNVGEGRPNLGTTTDVSVYRLMQFTLRDVLIKESGVEEADRVFYQAGHTAGTHFDPHLVQLFRTILPRIIEIRDEYNEEAGEDRSESRAAPGE